MNPLSIAGRTVLLVDDDAAVRHSVHRALEARGCTVVEAADAHEAQQALARARPDVVVMDLVLPGMEGREAANLISARQPGVPILFITGYTSRESMRAGTLSQEDAFMRKPFELSELIEAIARLLPGSSTAEE